MKKSLIALAVLGSVAGIAHAQSTVTLYGIADVYVGSKKSGLNTKRTTVVDSGGFNGSRFGLTGSEDLGGGLKAVFKLEQGFNIDTGTQSVAGSAFGRQAYVGLAGGFGTVTFGNVWSSMDDVIGAGNGAFDAGAFAPLYSMSGSVHNTYVDRPRNAIKYASPSFGGLSGSFTYGMDENSAASQDVVDFQVGYAAGPVGVSLAYQVANNVTDTKRTLLNGSYDLGVAKLLATYGQVKTGAAKSTDAQFGVDLPLSSALTLSGSYAQTKDNAFLGDGKRTGFGIAAKYALSKRTFSYAGLVNVDTKNGAGTKTDKYNLYAVGMQHSF
ncbi:porin [Hydrogenophaga sp.]|uniref:porin n=1 Tax=Hydrogenophaga sp. TaxID=1904254 RepID=UPI002731A71F|nr:porin [Hydrogenophaga sp.]MDP1686150.1 porin [Hydrogenophaga sp.]